MVCEKNIFHLVHFTQLAKNYSYNVNDYSLKAKNERKVLELQKHKWEKGNTIECSMNTCARIGPFFSESCDYDLSEKNT